MLRNCEALFNNPGRVKIQDIFIETEVGTAIFFFYLLILRHLNYTFSTPLKESQWTVSTQSFIHSIPGLEYILSLTSVCLLTQSCPTLCDPMSYSPPDSSVHGISQARILEWVAISFSRDLPRNQTQVSCIAGEFFTIWATRNLQLRCLKRRFKKKKEKKKRRVNVRLNCQINHSISRCFV